MSRNRCFESIFKMNEENNEKLGRIIDSAILSFCKTLSKINGSDVDEMYSIWKNGGGSYDNEEEVKVIPKEITEDDVDKELERHLAPQVKKSRSTRVSLKKGENASDNSGIETEASLNKKTKVELTAMCKSRGLKCSGNKPDLIDRLLGKESAVAKPATRKSPAKKKEPEVPAVIKKVLSSSGLSSNTPTIRKNKFGNYEHSETHFVYDPVTKTAIGKQSDDGSVLEFTKEDIELCHKFKIRYQMPDNLSIEKEDKPVEEEKLTEDDYKEEDETEEEAEEEEDN